MSFHMEAIRRSHILAKKKDAQFALSAKEGSKVSNYNTLIYTQAGYLFL